MSAPTAATVLSTHWLFVRGLSREARHWLPFPELFERDVAGARVHLLDLPGAGSEWRRRAPLSVGGAMRDLRRRWLRLRDAHPEDGACPSSPTTGCAQSIFGSTFTSADDGISGMFDGPPAPDGGTTVGAWALQAGSPCALAHQGVVNASFPTDIFGNARGTMSSMGAVQYTANAPCAQ
jgi:hypothetical protein